MSAYATAILAALPPRFKHLNPEEVEEAMRIRYPTLDALSKREFKREALQAAEFVVACPDIIASLMGRNG